MTDLDYAVKAILDSAHERVQAEITAAVADGADLAERVKAVLTPPADEVARLQKRVADLEAQLKNPPKGKAAVAPQPAPAAAFAPPPLSTMGNMPALTLSPQIEMPTPVINVIPAEPAAQPVVVDVTPFVTLLREQAVGFEMRFAAMEAKAAAPRTVVKTVVRDEHGRALRVIEEEQ